MKIRFVKTSYEKLVNPKDHKDYRPDELSYVVKTYEEGKVYDLSEDSAKRWLRRGAAEEAPQTIKARLEPETEVVMSPTLRGAREK